MDFISSARVSIKSGTPHKFYYGQPIRNIIEIRLVIWMKNMHTDGHVCRMLNSFLLYALYKELINICCFRNS